MHMLLMNRLGPYNSVPRVFLGANDVLTGQSHRDSGVIKGSHHCDVLLSGLGRLLACRHLVPRQAHRCFTFPTIGCCLLELLAKPEPQLDALDWGRGHGGLPQDEAHVELLQELLVFLISSLSVA